MNRFDFIYILISASIISLGYLILWTSPAHPGRWKKAGKLRRSTFHFSLWFIALFQLSMFSFGLGAFLLYAPIYYYLPIASCAAVASSIIGIEIVGIVIKSSIDWSNKKRSALIAVLSLIQFTFSTTLALLVRSKLG